MHAEIEESVPSGVGEKKRKKKKGVYRPSPATQHHTVASPPLSWTGLADYLFSCT